jgi:L-gulono-1,4-lactone dehydrogenase
VSSIRRGTWTNWAGNQSAKPKWINEPASESDVADIVARAAKSKHTVKAVGAGHSFTSTALTSGHLLNMKHLNKIVHVDRVKNQVTVEAGIHISELNEQLFELGLAMPNLGDIAYQTISGAIATSTHGTGAKISGIAGQVASMRLVNGHGEIVDIGPQDNPELLNVAQVGVGALGIVTQVTLNVVPAFRLRAVEGAQKLDALIENLDELVDSNEHFEFFWIPHTKWALTKRNNRTSDPVHIPSRAKQWYSKTFLENYAFGAVCALGRLKPSLIPRLATALPSSGQTEIVDESFRIFASERIVKFVEMEYAIPRQYCGEVLQRIRSMIDDKGHLISFPVEVRFTAKDDIALSTASGRDSAYIAVHMYKGMDYEPYFRDVANIMSDYEGRPHWGKMHFLNHNELSKLYPKWNEFLSTRDQLDPDRTFANAYTEQIFGK